MNPSYPGSSGDRHGPPAMSSATSAGLGAKGVPQQQQQQQQHGYHPQPSLAQLHHGGGMHPLHGGGTSQGGGQQHGMMHAGPPPLPPPPLTGSMSGQNGPTTTSRSPHHSLPGSILHPPRGSLGGGAQGGPPSVLGKPSGGQTGTSSGGVMLGHPVRMQQGGMSQSMGTPQQNMTATSGALKPSQGYNVRPQSPPSRRNDQQQQQQQQQAPPQQQGPAQVPIPQQQYGLDGRILPNDGTTDGDYYSQQSMAPAPRHRELRVEDALLYLDQVKQQFGDQPDIYNQFLDVMKDFKAQAIDTPGVIMRVSTLFRGYPNLILGFNTFLPPGYRIRPDTSIEVIPSQMSGRPGPNAPPQTMYASVGGQQQQQQQATSAGLTHRPPPVTIPPPPYSPPDLTQQHHKQATSTRQTLAPAPAGQAKASGKLKKQQQQATPSGGNAAARSATNPVEFDHAIHYVTTIKQRFADEPETYKEFLAILHTYQKEQRSIRQVLDQVSHLFRDHPDLLREFTFFLPDAVQEQAKERLNRAAEKAQQRKDLMAQKANKYAAMGAPGGYSQQQGVPMTGGRRMDVDSPSGAALKTGRAGLEDDEAGYHMGKARGKGDAAAGYKEEHRGLSAKALERREKERERERNRAQFQQKRAKRRPYDARERRAYVALSDVLLDKEEWGIFEKIKKILPSRDNWREFLKCLELYSQEVLDRNEMLSLIKNLFGRHTELVDEFDHLLGSHGAQKTPKEIWPFIPLAETDLSQCRRATPSYRGLPASYPVPPCSSRSTLEKAVCNDAWVSVPTGSEDFSFKSMRKNQYEEALFKCEDERFEIDMVIEANASTISILEPLALEIESFKSSQEAGEDDKLWHYVVDKGTFRVTHLNAITRIYGDAGAQILDLLRKYPAGAIPVILKRLKQKDEEWRRAREDLNRQWKEVNEKNYHKSLDHSSFYFKQKDKKQTSMKMMMQEAKKKLEADEKRVEAAKTDASAAAAAGGGAAAADVRSSPSAVSATAVLAAKAPPQASDIANALKKEQSAEGKPPVARSASGKLWISTPPPRASTPSWKPHFAYKMASVQIHKEAFGLLSYAAEKNLSVADKEKISKVWQGFFFPFFHLDEEWLVRKPKRTTLTLDKAKTLRVGTEVNTELGEGTVQFFHHEKGYFVVNLTAVGAQAYLQPGAITIQEAAGYPPGLPSLDDRQDAAKTQTAIKSRFYGSQHAYAFLRLYQMLHNRLERAFDLCEKAKRNRNRRTVNPAARALAHARHSLAAASAKEKTGDYQAFLSKVYALIDGSVDATKYEDTCRSLMGSTSYFLFTMDKLVALVLKQMQHLATDDTCQELLKLFSQQQATSQAKTADASEAEAAGYLNKTKAIFEGEGAFRIEFNPGVLRQTPLEAHGGSTPSGATPESFKIWAPSPRVKPQEPSKWLIEPELTIEYLGSMDEDAEDEDEDDEDDESPSATPLDTPSATPLDTPSATPLFGSPVHDEDGDEHMEDVSSSGAKSDNATKSERDLASVPATPLSDERTSTREQSDSAAMSPSDVDDAEHAAKEGMEKATLLKKRVRGASEEESAASPSRSTAMASPAVPKKKAKTLESNESEHAADDEAEEGEASQEEDETMEDVEPEHGKHDAMTRADVKAENATGVLVAAAAMASVAEEKQVKPEAKPTSAPDSRERKQEVKHEKPSSESAREEDEHMEPRTEKTATTGASSDDAKPKMPSSTSSSSSALASPAKAKEGERDDSSKSATSPAVSSSVQSSTTAAVSSSSSSSTSLPTPAIKPVAPKVAAAVKSEASPKAKD